MDFVPLEGGVLPQPGVAAKTTWEIVSSTTDSMVASDAMVVFGDD